MRRKDRAVTNIEVIKEIISKIKVCRLGIVDQDTPYIVPLNFGYTFTDQLDALYFHSAHIGRKIELIKTNPKVCFEMDDEHQLITGDLACDYTYDFVSIIGTGKIEFIEDRSEKVHALEILMKHQSGQSGFSYSDAALDQVCVYRLDVDEYQVKRHSRP
jgi:uncharacterized protein